MSDGPIKNYKFSRKSVLSTLSRHMGHTRTSTTFHYLKKTSYGKNLDKGKSVEEKLREKWELFVREIVDF